MSVMSYIRRHVTAPKAPQPTQYLSQSVPHWFEAETDKQDLYNKLWETYDASHGEPHDPIRVLTLMYLVRRANGAPDGDYVELGTHKGFAARLIWNLMDRSKDFYCFDTFEGFTESDLKIENQIYKNAWTVGNFAPTSPEGVANYVNDGKPAKNLHMVKGWFPDSFAGYENKKWRFIHIDMDLYQPCKKAMEILWPQLVPGGIMVVHDYGCYGFPGAKKAVDEFSRTVGIVPIEMADRWGSVIMAKPFQPA